MEYDGNILRADEHVGNSMTKNMQGRNLMIVRPRLQKPVITVVCISQMTREDTSKDSETDNPCSKTEVFKCQEWFAFIRSNLPANLELITVTNLTCYI